MGIEAYTSVETSTLVVTDATLEGYLDTENACDDAMSPLGYDTRLIDVETTLNDDPCTCIKFEDSERPEVSVTYNFAYPAFIS